MPYGVQICVNTGSSSGLLPEGTKPLPDSMLTNAKNDPQEHISYVDWNWAQGLSVSSNAFDKIIFNSLLPSNTICSWDINNSVLCNGLVPVGTKPLPEPVLTYHQWWYCGIHLRAIQLEQGINP